MIKARQQLSGKLGYNTINVYPHLEDLKVEPKLEEQTFKSELYGYDNVTVAGIKTEDISVTPTREEQNFDGIYNKVNVKAIEENSLDVTPSLEQQSFDGVYTEVNVNPINGENIVIDPKNEQQTFSGVYTDITVNEIQGDTLDITPSTQSQSFEGVYETVNVNPIKGDNLNIAPTTSEQSFKGVYTEVNVNKVTSSIDSNIRPENIKAGANILGVDGSYEGVDTSDATALPENILQGKTAYANNEKITGTMEEYDGSYEGTTGTGETSGIPVKDGLLYASEHKAGYSLLFNGVDTEIDTGVPQSALVDGFTIVLHMNPKAWNNYRGVFGIHQDGGINGLQYVDDGIYITIFGADGHQVDTKLSTSQLPINSWSTFILSWSNGRSVVYINGELVDEKNNAAKRLKPVGNLIVGKAAPYADRYFKGNMSHFIVYNRALSEEEITEMTNYIATETNNDSTVS